ncbi:MAG: hypothetical protein A2161_15770 [Candidatus Schekmanbacteria bacterium RBG_13_48_7]|uniref:Sigma-54 factor interaction domain-containing protein n=1 Tax=Candidatus Schekmanbacteria bacterium RBG_13_48_7 TaxID=1817878 RepID=A0A1F7RMR6_9BACT|nr:MAG: hypothetical protein A2161_15770 [Candidatus Schekmanbacteria bacterium RBG_13_48_7]
MDKSDRKNHLKKDQLPVFPDLMVLVPGETETGGMIIEKVPSWTAALIGKNSDEIEGKPVSSVFDPLTKAFSAISDDVLKDGIPVEDYEVEFDDLGGKTRTLSINAQRISGYTPAITRSLRNISNEKGYAVLIRIRDISSIIIKTKKNEELFAFHGIVGHSKTIRNVFHKIEIYGPTEAPVVITGETGTGKELVARALHEHSHRRSNLFVTVNCSALNEDLFESELFGHERGSFTGAVRAHRGRFERAHNGTLFLDEIGDMPKSTQVKLLRVLETNVIERVGGEREIPVDIRLIAATNLPLERSVAENRFRPDLYHRISVFRIHVPPLRERKDDIIFLIHYFLQLLNRRYKKNITQITPEAVRLLEDYYWPGNIRELRNVLERIYVETQSNVIGRNAFNEWVRERDYFSAGDWNIERLDDQKALTNVITPTDGFVSPSMLRRMPSHPKENYEVININKNGIYQPNQAFARTYPVPDPWISNTSALDAEYKITKPTVRNPELLSPAILQKAFREANGNITRAAALLGIHKATFYRQMKNMDLTREKLEKSSIEKPEPERDK